MKFIAISGIILTLFAFSFGCYSRNESPNYPKLARVITAKTAERLQNDKHLVLISTSTQMMDNIQMMGMGFNYYNTADLEIARKLLIYSIEEYLSEINKDQQIRPYLHEYPFTAENVEISIHFYNPDGSDVALDKIYYASAIDGKLSYYVDLPEKYSRKIIHEETYEQAL